MRQTQVRNLLTDFWLIGCFFFISVFEMKWHFLFFNSPMFCRVLKPPGGGSSDIFGTADLKPAAGTKSNHSDHFSSGSGFGGDLSDMGVKGSSIDSNDGASTPSQTSTSNGSPNNSEPNTPRSGKLTNNNNKNPRILLTATFNYFLIWAVLINF